MCCDRRAEPEMDLVCSGSDVCIRHSGARETASPGMTPDQDEPHNTQRYFFNPAALAASFHLAVSVTR
jgi:hypothetical protein